jgi:hypothetical protein
MTEMSEIEAIAHDVVLQRLEWDHGAVVRTLAQSMVLAGGSLVVLRAAAMRAAADPLARTPMALTWDRWYSAATSDGATRFLSGDTFCEHGQARGQCSGGTHWAACTPGQYVYCQHGVDARAYTVDNQARCPFCRGVTRRDRNSVPR